MTAKTWLAPALLAGLLAGLPVLAQETEAEAEGGGDGGLSVGVPEPGATYVAETHGDWEVRCVRAPEDQPELCQLYQLMTDASGNPVAEVNIFDLPDNDRIVAGATIVTPLDTLLTPQLRIRVGSGEPLRYPFSFCQQIGCFVRIGLTEEDLAAYRAGAEAIVTIVPIQAPDQTVDLTMSLRGFTDGFEDVAARTAAFEAAAAAAREQQSE